MAEQYERVLNSKTNTNQRPAGVNIEANGEVILIQGINTVKLDVSQLNQLIHMAMARGIVDEDTVR